MDFNIRDVVIGFLAIVISLTFHEFAHAFVADKLGDDTPRRHGRLTLNPMVIWRAHPFGSLLVPLIGATQGFLLGWAATPVNPSRVRRGLSVRKAEILIAGAGPASNLLLAVVSTGLVAAFVAAGGIDPDHALHPLLRLSQFLVITNLLLAAFNMIPVPPLDGYTVVTRLLGRSAAGFAAFMEQYGMLVLVLVFVFGARMIGPVFAVAGWLIRFAVRLAA